MNHREIGVQAAQEAMKTVEGYYPELSKQFPLLMKQWEHELGAYFFNRLNAYLAGALTNPESITITDKGEQDAE